MFTEELQDVPVELEDIAISESTRLTDDHWVLSSMETNLLLFPFFCTSSFFKVLIACNKPALPLPHNIVLQLFLRCTLCTCNMQDQSTAEEQVFSETIARKPIWPTCQDLLPLMPIMMPTYTAPTRAIPTVKATWRISTVGKKFFLSFQQLWKPFELTRNQSFPRPVAFSWLFQLWGSPFANKKNWITWEKDWERTVIMPRLRLGIMPPQQWESQWWWSTPSSTWLHPYHH